MTAENYTVGGVIDRLNYFLSKDLMKAKSVYMIQGGGKIEAAVSLLTMLTFASDKGAGIYDLIMLVRPEDARKYFDMVSGLNELVFEDSNHETSPFMDESQAVWYSRRKNIPYAVLLAGYDKTSKSSIIILNTLKSIDPIMVFNNLQEKCREQLSILKRLDKI